jgi:hypothetical protein
MLNFLQRPSTAKGAQYSKALRQLRLCIQDGGIGLTNTALVAPEASSVALRKILNWYCANATLWGGSALHLLSWLSDGTSSVVAAAHAFPSISHAFDQAVTSLQKWRYHGSLADTTEQAVITQLMKEQTSHEFRLDCSQAEQD